LGYRGYIECWGLAKLGTKMGWWDMCVEAAILKM
jgi:hypothetical protein